MITRQQIIDKMDSLPTLPTAVTQLSKLISSPDSSASDFEKIIKPDPSLTANLLRLANSAYFGLRREVSSVKQAVALLGSKRVFEIAASAGFSKVLPKRIPGYEIDASSFWTHSIAVAVLSETLAKELRLSSPQMLFTAGLLHDIGKLAVGQFLGESSDDVNLKLNKGESSFVEVEREVLGTDHQDIGYEIASSWDLPELVMWGAKWHHNPSDASSDVDSSLVDLIHVSNVIAHLLGYGDDSGGLFRTMDKGAQDRLGFTLSSLETISADTRDKILEMSKMFQSNDCI